MNIASGQKPKISKGNSLGEDHVKVLSLVIERDRGIQPEDIIRLTSWDIFFVLTILKELESVSDIRSEVIDLHTKWYTLTEEA